MFSHTIQHVRQILDDFDKAWAGILDSKEPQGGGNKREENKADAHSVGITQIIKQWRKLSEPSSSHVTACKLLITHKYNSAHFSVGLLDNTNTKINRFFRGHLSILTDEDSLHRNKLEFLQGKWLMDGNVKIIWFCGETKMIVKALHGRAKDSLIHWWMAVIKCSYNVFFKIYYRFWRLLSRLVFISTY